MSSYAPGTPIAVMKAMDERMYGKPQALGQSLPNPFDSNVAVQIGNSSGSATDGLGQIDKGSQTVGTALQRAQRANQASSEAIGGGGKNPMAGIGVAGITGSGNLGNLNKALGMKKGGKVKAYAKGGSVSSASSRGDGIAQRGKTKGRMC